MCPDEVGHNVMAKILRKLLHSFQMLLRVLATTRWCWGTVSLNGAAKRPVLEEEHRHSPNPALDLIGPDADVPLGYAPPKSRAQAAVADDLGDACGDVWDFRTF